MKLVQFGFCNSRILPKRTLVSRSRRFCTSKKPPWASHVKRVEEYLDVYSKRELVDPPGLFGPCTYLLNLPAKRIRPALVLLSHELFSDEFPASYMDAALSVELLHNSTLAHDDIMDESPLRRGYPTVHTKWDLTTGILCGNVLLVKSFQAFEGLPPSIMQQCMKHFSQMAIEIHIGQQYDIEFESRSDVTIPEYIEMIKFKTSVLLACAMKLGALLADAPEKDAQNIYDFGLNLGIAFQIQDDFLDLWGEQAKVGKRLGGDIYDNKKTILYLKALELANSEQREELLRQFSIREEKPEKLAIVKSIFEDLQIDQFAKEEMKKYKDNALDFLAAVETSRPKGTLELLSDYLIKRAH